MTRAERIEAWRRGRLLLAGLQLRSMDDDDLALTTRLIETIKKAPKECLPPATAPKLRRTSGPRKRGAR